MVRYLQALGSALTTSGSYPVREAALLAGLWFSPRPLARLVFCVEGLYRCSDEPSERSLASPMCRVVNSRLLAAA